MYKLIKHASIVNERKIYKSDVLIYNDRIEKISENIKPDVNMQIIDATGLTLVPGMIDTHVHFREPGMTYKGTIETESKAAIAGGVTSFMEMPNTLPNATSHNLVEEKYKLASETSYANYSFYFGLNAQNLDEALQIDNSMICGLTDDGLYFDNQNALLCNNAAFLDELFSKSKSLIALHCENEKIIKENEKKYKDIFGKNIPPRFHADIRSDQACYSATEQVIGLAKKHNSRLHVLHVSTAIETNLFEKKDDVRNKRVTSEACIHHLYFNSDSYASKGHLIKWNPSIKHEKDRQALLSALREGCIDNIATDHAPHLLEEKNTDYFSSRSGAPSVQHALPVLFQLYHRGEISLEDLVEKTSHNPAELFRIIDRGYIREGYYADLVLLDLHQAVSPDSRLLYKCGWTPFANEALKGQIKQVYVNGSLIAENGNFTGDKNSKRLFFSNSR